MTIENNRIRISVAIALFAVFLFPIVATVQPALAQSDLSVETAYSSSYEISTADVTRPITINAENHLYYPGGRVSVEGSVWSEVVEAVEALNMIKVEIKDWSGDVAAMSDAELNKQTGRYETSLKLPDNASTGTYTVESRIELEADALGIVEAITSATLQSSVRIAVAEPNEYEVRIENQTYSVQVASNSALNGFEFKQQDKAISIFAEGNSGTTGVMEISVPKNLMSGEMAVFIDGSLMSEEQVILKSDSE
ncbi:MAG: hypothetical protein ACRD99_00885, partial [Nitrososphaera sp.]